jgi:hypothetical protein
LPLQVVAVAVAATEVLAVVAVQVVTDVLLQENLLVVVLPLNQLLLLK